MAKIRHIAMVAEDVDGTAKFYEEVFGLERVGVVATDDVDGVYLSDGDINLAILNFKGGPIKAEIDRGDAPGKGLQHIGFLVEDTKATRQKLAEHGAVARNILPTANANMFFEEKFTAAGGIIIDVTGHPWPGAKPLPEAEAAGRH